MSKHGTEPFTCFCGNVSRHPVVVRGLRQCADCAFAASPSDRIGADMRSWNGQGWGKPQVQIKRVG